jgi:hypothetical protein
MSIASRIIKRLFRRKPRTQPNADIVGALASLELQARSLAETIFESQIYNPPPLTSVQIGEATVPMFREIAEDMLDELIAHGVAPDLAAFSSDRAAAAMYEGFMHRYAELIVHGDCGPGRIQ